MSNGDASGKGSSGKGSSGKGSSGKGSSGKGSSGKGSSGKDPNALPARVEIYDTTLRDGTQREGISFSVGDKLRVAKQLDELGVAYIEGGYPGSNPKDAELFRRVREMPWKHATFCAFGSTARAGVAPEDDAQLRALVEAQTEVCTIFGKTWTLHVKDVLRTKLEDNLRTVEDSVAFLVAQGRRVFFDAEHYFDGYFDDPGYAIEVLHAAKRGGAEVLVLCETNGGRLPWEVEDAVRDAREALEHPIGIHAHNDSGCGVANSLGALRAGATQIQGTINGYGERCGNANLCTIVADAELKLGVRCLPEGGLRHMTDVARYVAEVANLPLDAHLPFVGRSAFAHKGGIHVSAIRREKRSYEHIEPEEVGNETRVLVSELSGRSNLRSKAEELGVELEDGHDAAILDDIKAGEARGMAYEVAEASVALLMHRRQADYEPLFRVVGYHVSSASREGAKPWSEASIKVAVGEEHRHTVAEGTGPVHALDIALRKALRPFYPEVDQLRLEDYKVRILDGNDGTGAITRVLIDTLLLDESGHEETFCTVGASNDIVEASLQALLDQLEHGLLQLQRRRAAQPASAASSNDSNEPGKIAHAR